MTVKTEIKTAMKKKRKKAFDLKFLGMIFCVTKASKISSSPLKLKRLVTSRYFMFNMINERGKYTIRKKIIAFG